MLKTLLIILKKNVSFQADKKRQNRDFYGNAIKTKVKESANLLNMLMVLLIRGLIVNETLGSLLLNLQYNKMN